MYIKITNEKKYKNEQDKKYQTIVDSIFQIPENIFNFTQSTIENLKNGISRFTNGESETKNKTLLFLGFV
jgi:ABC-type dipeptide/oligopeptide/nickel transport system ATPase subunit